jgi:hypothetical protein
MTRHPRFVLILTVALGLVLACGPTTIGLTPSPTGSTAPLTTSTSISTSIATEVATAQDIPLIPNPLNVQITLDPAKAQTSVGLLYLQIANNATFAMTVPEDMASMDASGTLLPAYGTPVTMTSVSTIEGFPFSRGVLAAVNLAPEGLILILPATLTLTLPGEYAPDQLVGFTADANGDNFHLYPINISSGLSLPGASSGGTIVAFDILHFSVYGVALATSQEILDQQARVPQGATAQNEDLLFPLTPLKFVELDRQNVKFQRSLLSLGGVLNCNDVDVAAQEFITWYTRVKQAKGQGQFNDSIKKNARALLPYLLECMKDVCSLCMGTPPGNKQSTDAFLIHAFYAEQIARIAGLPDEALRWWTLANQCATNAGRPLPHLGGDFGCGNDCPVGDSGPTPVPPVCP